MGTAAATCKNKISWTLQLLVVELTSDMTDMANIDAKLSRGRSTFTSLSKVFCSSALSVKLKLVQVVKTDHGYFTGPEHCNSNTMSLSNTPPSFIRPYILLQHVLSCFM